MAGRIVERCGDLLPSRDGNLTRLFPTPEALLSANLDKIGIPGSRVRTLRLVAEAVVSDSLVFDAARPERYRQSLLAIPGIGDWTAQYVSMRLGEPDSFPAADLGLLKSIATKDGTTPKELLARAEAWRPWRAYAALVLWNATGD